VRLRLLPDSVPVPVASILPKSVDDSLNRKAIPADTGLTKDTLGVADTAQARRRVGPVVRVRPANEPLTARPPLFDALTLRVPRPWAPGARLVLEIRGVRNVSGVAGNPVGVVAVPAKPKPVAKPQARDTTRAQPQAPPRK
jgi:hypothetical protein